MNSMRYNPSQAHRLLLDPLISAATAKLRQNSGGFCIQSPVKRGLHTLDVFTDTSHPVSSFPRRACPATGLLLTPSLTTTVINRDLKRIAARRILKRIPISPA